MITSVYSICVMLRAAACCCVLLRVAVWCYVVFCDCVSQGGVLCFNVVVLGCDRERCRAVPVMLSSLDQHRQRRDAGAHERRGACAAQGICNNMID